MILEIKWRFGDYPRLAMTKDRIIYQVPFFSGRNDYGWREIKEKYHCGQLMYRINGKWVSKKKLNGSAYLVDEKIQGPLLPEKYRPFNNLKTK